MHKFINFIRVLVISNYYFQRQYMNQANLLKRYLSPLNVYLMKRVEIGLAKVLHKSKVLDIEKFATKDSYVKIYIFRHINAL